MKRTPEIAIVGTGLRGLTAAATPVLEAPVYRMREELDNGTPSRRPHAAFWGWCGVWLDPRFRTWSLEEEAERVAAFTDDLP